MLVSGSIGIVILSKKIYLNKNKIIIILSDSHSATNYCSILDESVTLTEFLQMNKNHQILIEEIPVIQQDMNIQDIWYNIPHIKELKDYFLKNSKDAIGIDIRFSLVPFSLELVHINKSMQLYKLDDYLKEFELFFNGRGHVFTTYFIPYIDISEVNKLHSEYNDIKHMAYSFIYHNTKPTILDFINKDIEFTNKLFEKIDNLINSIMEFYVIIKLLSVNKPTIIHMGLYHTSNIIDKLVTEYDCKIIYKNGITEFPPIDDNQEVSCIKIL
jgi:hypothetical protein